MVLLGYKPEGPTKLRQLLVSGRTILFHLRRRNRSRVGLERSPSQLGTPATIQRTRTRSIGHLGRRRGRILPLRLLGRADARTHEPPKHHVDIRNRSGRNRSGGQRDRPAYNNSTTRSRKAEASRQFHRQQNRVAAFHAPMPPPFCHRIGSIQDR